VSLSPFTKENYLENKSPLSWSTISETSDLITTGHQIGEAELLLPKLKMKKSRNK
jgi:hypothetical protein